MVESPQGGEASALAEVTKWLGGTWTASANVIKAAWPLAVSLIPALSRQYLQHRAGLNALELAKEAMRGEQKIINEVRGTVLKEIAGVTDPSAFVALKQRLEFIDEQTRAVPIYLKALEAIGNSQKQLGSGNAEISEHWTDQFQRFARQRNEPWRAELLARALATEAMSPGSVTVRLIWTIGTMEEEIFHCFEAWLECCVKVGKFYILPFSVPFELGPVPVEKARNRATVGTLIFDLSETGLLSGSAIWDSKLDDGDGQMWKGDFSIGTRRAIFEPVPHLAVAGVMLTSLGLALAAFCDPRPNSIAAAAFEAVKNHEPGSAATVKELEP